MFLFEPCSSQMISQEDYTFIVAFDSATGKERELILQDQRQQCAKTFLNLMGHISKNQTIYYILVLIDDMFTVKIINFLLALALLS